MGTCLWPGPVMTVVAATLRRRSRRDAGADRARHTGAAEPAIAGRIFRQILLVIVLGEIELRRLDDLGGDLAIAFGRQRLAERSLGFLGRLLLRRGGRVDAGAILGADVVALAHTLGRVVALPE